MEILKAICVLLLLLFIGIGFEKMFHMDADLSKCVHLLKSDICKVIKALLTKEEIRCILEEELGNKVKAVTGPYSAVGMDIDVGQGAIDETPCMCENFVPNKKLDEQDLQRVTDLVKVTFKRYLFKKGLLWRYFAYYEAGPDYVRIYVFYEEFEKDKPHFEAKYRELVREKVGADYGCLRDADLDKQLSNI